MSQVLVVTVAIVFCLAGHGRKMHADKAEKKSSISDQAKAELTAVLKKNEELHGASFTYDGKKVAGVSAALADLVDKVSDQKIKKMLTFSQGKLRAIKADGDREENNKNYHLFSSALIHVITKYDVNSEYSPYNCPMVKKNWIQNTTKMAKVHNPYAPEMPHCGARK